MTKYKFVPVAPERTVSYYELPTNTLMWVQPRRTAEGFPCNPEDGMAFLATDTGEVYMFDSKCGWMKVKIGA